MKNKQIRLARQLMGLNQTDFATLLGWTSKRNVVNLERGDKEVMTQTALAIECLVRRNNKFGKFQMLNTMQPVLDFIINEIKSVNKSRSDGNTISQDDTNEELINIFHDAMNKFTEIDFDLVNDEDYLSEFFGLNGYRAIREAESGNY